MKKNQTGSSHIIVFIIIIALAIAGFAAYKVLQIKDSSGGTNSAGTVGSTQPTIKNIGINLDYYDKDTQTAGDIKFIKLPAVEGGLDSVFMEYGRWSEANSAAPRRRNPQPTFVAPLGTKVHALVDGTVVNVPKLYSGDYSVHVQPKGSDLIFETEHVINVKVKEGDTVKAGDIVGEVSDYDSKNLGGLGLFEIGILKGGNPPKHICTFDYLDESIKAETLKKITALENAWEEFSGNPNYYNQSAEPTPGCATAEQVEG